MSLGGGRADAPRPLLLGMGWFPHQAGGLNRYFQELFFALQAQGLAPQGVVLGPADEGQSGDLAIAASARELLPRRLWRYWKAVHDAGADSDLVDAHFALYAAGPIFLGSVRRLPLVLHFHGPWADEGKSAGEGSSFRAASKRLLERRVYRRAREAIVLSAAFRRILVEQYGVQPWRINVVPPGVDLDRFVPGNTAASRRRLGVPDSSWVAVSVRRLVPRTGIDILVAAWAELARLREDVLLLVVGDGPARARLEQLSRDLGLDETVRFVGPVSDRDLTAYYQLADVCVVPSLALEGFGLVVLEALACGPPVIASDSGGLPEALAGLDSNLVVAAGDVYGLAQRLEAAAEGKPALPSRASCRHHAERFSWSEVAERHHAIYRRVAAPSGPRKLRVVYLDHCAQLSGAEISLLRLLPSLNEVDAHVVLGEEGPLVSRLLRAGISVEVLPMPAAARNLRRERLSQAPETIAAAVQAGIYAARLAHRLRHLRPDLVHTNSLKSALYGSVAAKAARVPVVWHLRDRLAEDYLPMFAVRIAGAGVSWLADGVIAISAATLETIRQEARRKLGERIAMIHDPVVLDPRPRQGSTGSLCFGIVGRIAPWKGQHVFLEAFARAFPHGAEQARIVGAPLFGEEVYEKDLRARASRLGLDGRVEFTGFNEDVAAELSQLDVLVHASVIPEPFGQVVIEGMTAGIPVLAANAGGPAEVIEDGRTGLLYDPGDADALAAAMKRAAAEPDLRRRLAQAGRAAAQAFAPDLIAEEVMRLYRLVLSRRA
jgi:glycosyltransferase involved in cell wall biosynthesis